MDLHYASRLNEKLNNVYFLTFGKDFASNFPTKIPNTHKTYGNFSMDFTFLASTPNFTAVDDGVYRIT